MSELTRVGEQAFPFPWNIFFYGDGVHYIETDSDRGFWIMEEKGDGSTKRPDSAEGRAAMKYIVRSANLMPEAVELLKTADKKLIDLCYTCFNAMDAAGLGRFVDCKNCNVESLDTSIKALLAKLEGGAEE